MAKYCFVFKDLHVSKQYKTNKRQIRTLFKKNDFYEMWLAHHQNTSHTIKFINKRQHFLPQQSPENGRTALGLNLVATFVRITN